MGVTNEQFEDLHHKLKDKLETTSQTLGTKGPSGRKRALSTSSQLLLFLFWMRQYLNERILSWLFGISDSTVNDYIQSTKQVCYNYFTEK